MQRAKRFACALGVCMIFAAMLFGLAACGEKAPPAPAPFSAEISIAFGESRQSAVLTMERPGALRLAFSAPKVLNGFAVFIEGDVVSLEYGGLQTALSVQALPIEGAASLLNRVMLQLAQPAEQAALRQLRGGGWERAGTANGLEYTVRLDENGALVSLKAPKAGLEIKVNSANKDITIKNHKKHLHSCAGCDIILGLVNKNARYALGGSFACNGIKSFWPQE